jgi:multiple antibiotic resistance protein
MQLNLIEIFSAFIVLFAVIDIIGAIPVIIDLKAKSGTINAAQASIISYVILIVFLFVGEAMLGLFGVDIGSFAVAGAFVLFILAMEMILGREIFIYDLPGGASIVPIAFPLIAGAGSFTTILALRAEYEVINIIIALTLNIIVVYTVLRATRVIEHFLGKAGIYILKKFFGIILLAISIKLFLSNISVLIKQFWPTVSN